jgi:lysophospholipid acyltransferase 7
MTVSAFWHGIHPGYYLSFLTMPPNLVAEELMAAAFREAEAKGKAENNDHRRLSAATFDWICWFFKMRSFDYTCMGFLLLGFSDTLRYWQSIYFIVHIYIAIFIAVGLAYRPRRAKASRDGVTKEQ